MILNVFCNAYGRREFVGKLSEEKARVFFEYAPEFISKGIELSPFMLPLKQGIFEDTKRTFGGLFGLFNDSLPDGWGCLLLDRKLRSKGLSYEKITPLHRLSMIGNNPMGALEYEPAVENGIDATNIELDSLAYEADKILAGENSTVLDRLLNLNGSSGGARPKIVALVSDDKKNIIHGTNTAPEGYSHWLIKFSSSMDAKDIGAIEYIYSLMARKAGLCMPETYLFESNDGPGHFGVKRFDRVNGHKVHIHTACGLIHASHRYSSIDYETLIKLTSLLTKNERDIEMMVRLMIFNVKSGNRDDHSKNFSFLLAPENTWQLAPAYDLTPSQGINGQQTSMVNGKGENITDQDFIEVGRLAGISAQRVREIIDQIDDVLGDFSELKRVFCV